MSTAKIQRRLMLALLALLACGAAQAASASAAPLEFEPGVYAKAHAPLVQETPLICFNYQCGINFPGELESWIDPLEAAPELTQAGAHPDFTTHFRFVRSPSGEPHTILTDAPAGSIGNPLAVPRCEAADFNLTVLGACPKESQVGVALTDASGLGFLSPVSSLVPYPGAPALLGFKSTAISALLVPEVRSEGDYGLRIRVSDIPIPLIAYTGSTLTLWGVPHDPVHNPHRVNDVGGLGGVVGGTPAPFLSAPTNCSSGPIDLTVRARSWEDPAHWAQATSTAPEPSGCEQIAFEPELSAEPSTDVADSPSGLDVDVHTPQNNEGCEPILPAPTGKAEPRYDCGLATSHLKDTTLTLPEGLAINPAGANGLDGCSPQEIGLSTAVGVSPQQFTKDPPSCPEASAIAEVEIQTPLLDVPMPGRAYIADPYENPFGSLLALYIVADYPERGLIVKLAGEVSPDPVTGQLTTTVTDAPQLPFEHFRLHFKQGPHAPLTTPPACGDYESEAELVPYSDPGSARRATGSWSITAGPGGGCAAPAHAPSFDAGAVSPIAGAYSPFVISLRREDGTQRLGSVTISPPAGLTAKLAATPYCPEAALAAAASRDGRAEQAAPSCPAASRVGSVHAAAGSGPDPYNAPGAAYLSGPYKGAPLSLATVVPALAGPFDLGTVVVRAALHVDPRSAQITAVSDPIPSILHGIPLDVRRVDVALDRPQFSKNPTSCEPTAVGAEVFSTLGAATTLSQRFQLGECRRLGFKPRLYLRLFGKRFGRGSNPRLRAVLVPRPGDANIARAVVRMPRSILLDQAHIRTVCTRVQFAAEACPPGARYGYARAFSPLLDQPVEGPVWLRSSDNTLPDLVADLSGQVRVEAVGRTDSARGALRNSFDIVPDVPVSKFVLLLQGGRKSLLQAGRNLCARTPRALVAMRAHNGRISRRRQRISIPRCAKLKRAAKRRHGRR